MSAIDLTPLYISLKVASLSILVVFVAGVVLARLFARSHFYGKSILEAFFLLPLILPPTVVGFGLLLLFGKNGWIGQYLLPFDIQFVFSWHGAVVAAIVVSFPMMYQSALAAFQSLDEHWEHVARTLGASEWRIFWTISFPLAWPGLLAGLVLAFARGLGEFGATLMLAGYIPGRTETIPLAIYFAVEAGQFEKAAFWCLIIVMIGFSATLWLNWWGKKRLSQPT